MPKITKLTASPVLQKPKKVAAYARVSSGKDAMLHSLSVQVSYYNNLISGHNGWQFAGVYTDEAVTGTKETRENFQRLLQDCHAGLIDMIITKSISRFARNTVTLLTVTRELKSLGIDVFFEEQSIHTMSTEGELMLTILASYAQEESLSASENQKWRIRRNFKEGIPWNSSMLGYRFEESKFVVVPEEAEIVKSIFLDYLSGMGSIAIAKKLNTSRIPTLRGNKWYKSGVMKILENYTYTGNLLLQKTFRENHLTKKKLVNHGELPRYHVEETHEAIISLATYNAVQVEIARRAAVFAPSKAPTSYPFSGLIECANCGKHYRRKTTTTGIMWVCATYNTQGKDACQSKQIPESILITTTLDVLQSNTLDDLRSRVSAIRAKSSNTLVYSLKSGETATRQWKDRSRSESWTPEMKQAAREKVQNRRRNN